MPKTIEYTKIIYIMKDLTIETKVHVYQFDELPEEYKSLVEKAKNQVKNSYSPYSHFSVGAAALLNDGTVFTGSNQENCAYPSGLCAERTTLFYANANRPDMPVKALAIACFTEGHYTQLPGSPCGSCRQVILETETRFNQDIQVILYGEKETYIFDSAKALLPLCFVSDNLKG